MGDTTTTDSGTSSWEKWIQQIGGGVVGAWSNATYTQPYEIQKMRIQALGSQGYYTEGRPGVQPDPIGSKLNPLMIMGAGLLLVVLLARGRA